MDSENPGKIKIGALLWTQKTDWNGLRGAVLAAEDAGWDSLWVSDHLLNPIGDHEGPVFEAWTAISAIGALTRRVTVGLIVGSNTFRHPGLVAKMAVTLDNITDGRAVLGIGAGWYEPEHRMHGIQFEASAGARIDRLSAAVAVIRRLIDGDIVDHESKWYSLVGAKHEPRPVQARLPILIGGEGPTKTLPLVAAQADMWNARGSVESLAATDAILRDHCARVGRDPNAIERLTNRWVVVRDDSRDAERAMDDTNRVHGIFDPDPGIIVTGPPEAAAAAIQPVIKIGFRHLIVSLRAPWDLETIARFPDVRELLVGASRASK